MIKNKLFLTFIVGLLLISLVSAFDWDNIKEYNATDNSITFKNSFLWFIPLDPIAKVKLDTPQINLVMPGKNRRVAEITFDNHGNYGNALGDIKLYDKNNNMIPLERNVSYKYKNQIKYDKPTYEYVCTDGTSINQSTGTFDKICSWIQNGTEKAYRYEWSDYPGKNMAKGQITLGIYADVYEGDNIEWIGTYFGKKADEWAIWTASLSIGLQNYWDMNGTTDIVAGNINLTEINGARDYNTSSCLIGKCGQDVANTPWQILPVDNANRINLSGIDYTLNFWIRPTVANTDNTPLGSGSVSVNMIYMGSADTSLTNYKFTQAGSGAIPSSVIGLNKWAQVTITHNKTTSNTSIYINGTIRISGINNATNNITIYFGNRASLAGFFVGQYDEIAYWNRTLSASEIADLGDGQRNNNMTYVSSFGISAALISPGNNNVSNVSNIEFNCSATAAVGTNLTNISLFTNASGTLSLVQTIAKTGTTNTSSFTENLANGYYNWTCQACGSDGICAMAGENRTIFVNASSNLNVILSEPATGTTLTQTGINFTANYTSTTGINFTNATYYVWSSSGTLFNQTLISVTGNGTNSSKLFIDGFFVGDYKWNVLLCATGTNCTFASSNFTFTAGSTINQTIFPNPTYETSSNTFITTLNILPGAQLSLAQLVYNNVNYSISNINLSANGSLLTLTKTIDVPLNNGTFTNQINSYYFKITYNGGASQTFGTNTQNVSFINLQNCNSTYNQSTLNFTIVDEQTNNQINASFNSYFSYWLGGGSVIKTYNFSDTNINVSQFNFCKNPNQTFYSNMDATYTNPLYLPREYHLRNASLQNTENLINLYLLNSSIGIKFFFTVIRGAGTRVDNAIVQIDKYTISNNSYVANSNRLTDGTGKFIEYLQQDSGYRFTVIKNGQILGIVNQTATCTAAPCEITLFLDIAGAGDPLSSYYATYANGTASNISFNPTTKIVAYNFIDLTGLNNYFRLVVKKGSYNTSEGITICDTKVYSTSGSITCNMTGYDGDFMAKGYISRSPEALDKILSFVINLITNDKANAPYILLFLIGWIITITFGTLALSRGNPSTTIAGFMIAFLSAKLMGFNPFSWIIIVLVLLLSWFIMDRVGT